MSRFDYLNQIVDIGELTIHDIDEANVPVNCMMYSPEETESLQWEWTADNFMPRLKLIGKSWKIRAQTRKAIQEFVTNEVVPLYAIALTNLTKHGTNYYWMEHSLPH